MRCSSESAAITGTAYLCRCVRLVSSADLLSGESWCKFIFDSSSSLADVVSC